MITKERFLKNKLLIISLMALLPIGWITSCTMMNAKAVASSPFLTGYITSDQIDETSGIVAYRTHAGIFWINNDSGSEAILYAVNEQGKHLATLTILNAENHDWEDLSTVTVQGVNYIVIADTGDNDAEGTNYQLHFIKEPILNISDQIQQQFSATPAWTVNFTYPDKPRDIEAVAVDPIHQQVMLLSKREQPHQLLTLPIKQQANTKLMMATPLGDIPDFPSPLKLRLGIFDMFNYSNMPTSMDISPDGSMAAVLTYSSAYLYLKNGHESWLAAFSQTPKRIDFPTLKQAEAIAFDTSGKYLYITSERTPSPILKIDLSQYISMPLNDTLSGQDK
ncbi:hypothetical protein ACR30L_04565 [Psychromonas sp. PT13]|uniref:hypothetical protein n=1 Tax=Psychromonas sp. PT13 TaxID=3439547 RepID=UPI003EBF777F